MKLVIGIFMCVSGAAIGLYAGLWWAFIGGIVDVVTEVRAEEMEVLNIAIGIAKVIFAQAIGIFSALILVAPGYALINVK